MRSRGALAQVLFVPVSRVRSSFHLLPSLRFIPTSFIACPPLRLTLSRVHAALYPPRRTIFLARTFFLHANTLRILFFRRSAHFARVSRDASFSS